MLCPSVPAVSFRHWSLLGHWNFLKKNIAAVNDFHTYYIRIPLSITYLSITYLVNLALLFFNAFLTIRNALRFIRITQSNKSPLQQKQGNKKCKLSGAFLFFFFFFCSYCKCLLLNLCVLSLNSLRKLEMNMKNCQFNPPRSICMLSLQDFIEDFNSIVHEA